MPELRRLRYFLAVADELNFSRAAERLHVAQPALSRQIRLLEQELGAELLLRTTHDVALTEAGRFLHSRGPALISDADELWRSTRSFGTGERGSLILAFGTSAGYETAPRLIAAMGDRAPGLRITTRVLPQTEILDGIATGAVDVGIVRTPPDGVALESRLLRLERQGALLPRGHSLARRRTVRLDQLDGEPLLLHRRDANPGHYDAVLRLFEQAGLTPEVLIRWPARTTGRPRWSDCSRRRPRRRRSSAGSVMPTRAEDMRDGHFTCRPRGPTVTSDPLTVRRFRCQSCQYFRDRATPTRSVRW